jgi:hypothetical protein
VRALGEAHREAGEVAHLTDRLGHRRLVDLDLLLGELELLLLQPDLVRLDLELVGLELLGGDPLLPGVLDVAVQPVGVATEHDHQVAHDDEHDQQADHRHPEDHSVSRAPVTEGSFLTPGWHLSSPDSGWCAVRG